MKDGFLRVACATPEIKVADCENNANNIIKLIKEANDNDVALIVFPELCITAYTCNDLFYQDELLEFKDLKINIQKPLFNSQFTIYLIHQ